MSTAKKTPPDQGGAAKNMTERADIVQESGEVHAPANVIEYSVFPSKTDTKTIKRTRSTWDELASELIAPRIERSGKGACPLIKLARFGDGRNQNGSLRHAANVEQLYGVEGDYDDEEVTLAQAADLLAAQGVEAVLYTSASNGVVTEKSSGGPRWRVMAPLSRPHDPSEHERLVAMLDDALGGILAPESYTDGQTFYYGRVRGVPFEARRVRGLCIDEMDFILSSARPAKSKTSLKPIDQLDMPELLPDKGLPALDELELPEHARAFLEEGVLNAKGDGSGTLAAATAALYEAVARRYQRTDDATVLSILAANPSAWEVALNHREQDGDKALEYLWKHHCLKQREKGAAVIDEFATVAGGDAVKAAQSLPPFERDQASGAIKATKQNITWALGRSDVCGYQLRHDTFRDEVMLAAAGTDGWRAFRDTDYHELCIRLESGAQGFRDIAKEKIRDAVAYVAEGNAFDSAQHWLGLQEWDGVPRIEGFLPTYFGTEDTPYTRAVGLYLWTALAGRVLEPGIKADMVPAAVGRQGAGKSRTVAAIVPAADFFLELDLGSKDDDLARLMRGKLVIELGELKGLRAKEVEHIKAFITRQYEEWVPKYREMNVRYARRGVFFATTNQDEFLSDDTGNRRWLPFQAGECDPTGVATNRGQLWAEGRELFKAKGVMWQDAERLASTEHDDYIVRDTWEAIVREWLGERDALTGGAPGSREFLQTHEVLSGALQLNARNITRKEETRIGGVMRKLGYQRERRRVGGERAYVYARVSLPVPTLSLPEAE